MSEYRIGFGEDIHALVIGRKLILAGIEIPYEKGLLGHSDADIVLHAVSDAILGALALGDIGKFYPPSDPKTEGIDSAIILKDVCEKMAEAGYRINNVDINIVAEAPKLAPYILAMREHLSALLNTDIANVSIKAKTNEGFDAIGTKQAMRASAVVLLKKENCHDE